MKRERFADRFYTSSAWRKCRADYLFSVGGMCEMCWREGIVEVDHIEVHHINKLTPNNINDPSVSMGWDNLIALCKKHHDEQHPKGKRERCIVDEFGHVKL